MPAFAAVIFEIFHINLSHTMFGFISYVFNVDLITCLHIFVDTILGERHLYSADVCLHGKLAVAASVSPTLQEKPYLVNGNNYLSSTKLYLLSIDPLDSFDIRPLEIYVSFIINL